MTRGLGWKVKHLEGFNLDKRKWRRGRAATAKRKGTEDSAGCKTSKKGGLGYQISEGTLCRFHIPQQRNESAHL